MSRKYEQEFTNSIRSIMLGEAKTTSHPMNVSMDEISNTLNDLLSKMDKNDPIYSKMAALAGSIDLTASSTVKPNKVKTKHAQEPKQMKPVVNNGNPLEVGDILNDCFSYNMTFNNYYQVVGVKSKTLTVRPIEKKWVSGDIGWTGYVVPVKDAFAGQETTIKLRGNFAKKSDVSIKSPDRGGRIYYVEPKPDGSYPSNYENHLD